MYKNLVEILKRKGITNKTYADYLGILQTINARPPIRYRGRHTQKHGRIKHLSAERLSQYTENRVKSVTEVNKRTS